MEPLGTVVHEEAVMGTVVSLHVTAADPERARTGIAAVCRRLHELEAILSLWRDESPISRLRRGELSLADAPWELVEVLEACRAAVTLSHGFFDPWAMPGGVDPTGLAKGWALEESARLLDVRDGESAMLNCGGDVRFVGTEPGGAPWRVGIQHPWRRDALAAVLEATDAVATSGSYERGAHLVDPRTGEPALTTASGTVVGRSLTLADALATALAVGGDEALEAIADVDGYEGYLIRLDGSEGTTAGLQLVRSSPAATG